MKTSDEKEKKLQDLLKYINYSSVRTTSGRLA